MEDHLEAVILSPAPHDQYVPFESRCSVNPVRVDSIYCISPEESLQEKAKYRTLDDFALAWPDRKTKGMRLVVFTQEDTRIPDGKRLDITKFHSPSQAVYLFIGFQATQEETIRAYQLADVVVTCGRDNRQRGVNHLVEIALTQRAAENSRRLKGA